MKADPYEEDAGPISMCINCFHGVIWLKGKGWVHEKSKEKDCAV